MRPPKWAALRSPAKAQLPETSKSSERVRTAEIIILLFMMDLLFAVNLIRTHKMEDVGAARKP
jgi:hypothetical protein